MSAQCFRYIQSKLAGLAILVSCSALAGEIAPKLQAEMNGLGPDDEVAVIIRFKDPVDLGQFNDNDRRVRRDKMIRALKEKAVSESRQIRNSLTSQGARRQKELWLINGRSATVSVRAVSGIAANPRVASVDLDRTITLSGVPVSCNNSPAGWNLGAVNASELWAMGFDGAGVVVATMDSGADPNHPDLSLRWRGGSNSWYDPNGVHGSPFDADGHGTWALGLLVGGDAGGAPIGMAPGAQWISAKIFDDAGTASLSAIHDGFQWMLDPDGNPATDDAADIVNNSWVLEETVDECDNEFQADIDALNVAEIAVVVSAGNSGPGPATSMSPANDPQSVSVGYAAESAGTILIAESSARGPSACDGGIFPTLVAPGANVATADLTLGGQFPDSYACVSGTSFAAPHVSGALALLKSAANVQGMPVTVAQLEMSLIEGAADMGESGPDNDWGAGLMDVQGAWEWLVANVPGDADGDGYTADVDCDDSNASVYPGAPEIKKDGIDQDCNGYDLTIVITRAIYGTFNDRVVVLAKSDLGLEADLRVTVHLQDGGKISRKMAWNAGKKRWQKKILDFAERFGVPKSVTVRGVEGKVSTQLQ